MDPTTIRRMPEWFGQTGGETLIHPIGLIAVLFLGVLLLLLPRRWAVLPMVIIACFIPSAQRVVVIGLDFTLLRIMVLFGVARLLLRDEFQDFSWKKIDKMIVLYAISATLILTAQRGTFSTFVNRLGFSFDALGMYFLFRCLIRSWEDIDRLILGSIVISIPVAAFFAFEHLTRRNLFSIFGGVPAITTIRQGELRCQGAFSHPIMAGCFWAVWIPLFAAYWWKGVNERIWAVIGVGAALFIIATCNSSTPVFGVLMAVVGGLAFYGRHQMRTIRWGTVILLIFLHLIKERPVWSLVATASYIGSGTGYHRYRLIDAFIRRFNEWWLLGTASTAHWGPQLYDVTNQYVLEGVRGGLLTLILFIALIVLAFQGVGRLWRLCQHDRYRQALAWALGVSLFVHCVNFIGVSYFGQIHIAWYLVLSIIGSMSPASERIYREAMKAIQVPRGQRRALDVMPQLIDEPR
jgi:hypothetical protein